jgi:spermidine synthase
MPDTSRGSRLTLPVFLLSTAVLALELLMVRLLAVGLWHHVTYMVVTVALLAFGLAGTILAVAPALGGRTPEGRRRALAWYAVLFGLSSLGSLVVMAGEGIDTINLVKNPGLYLDLFVRYMVTGLPLLFGGLGIVVGLKGEGRGIARVYFSNLLGSALGCVLFVLLLQPLTGPGLLGLAVLAGGLAGVLAARGGSRFALLSSVVTVLMGATLIALPGSAPQIRPVDSKMMAKKLAQGGKVETTLWNPICRIDVVTEPGASSPLNVYQDGDAPTWIFKGGDQQATNRHDTLIPYLIRPDAKSLLVIGSGGGREIATAISQKLERIVGLDINNATVSLLKDRYKEYSGDIAGHEAVDLVAAEGRAWLSHTDEKFDFIQMTGVDTYAALNSGAYVLSESYLYTAEAMKSYLDHLTPGGFVSILRFYFEPPRESLRLFVTALEELKSGGVADPGRQALVVAAGSWAALIMGHGTIPPQRLAEVRDMVRELGAQHVSEQRGSVKIVHDPERELDTPFSRFARAIRDGREEAFKDEYLYEVSPARDDSPFFYNFHRWDRYFENLFTDGGAGGPATTTEDEWRANTGDIPLGIMVLVFLLLLSTAAGLRPDLRAASPARIPPARAEDRGEDPGRDLLHLPGRRFHVRGDRPGPALRPLPGPPGLLPRGRHCRHARLLGAGEPPFGSALRQECPAAGAAPGDRPGHGADLLPAAHHADLAGIVRGGPRRPGPGRAGAGGLLHGHAHAQRAAHSWRAWRGPGPVGLGRQQRGLRGRIHLGHHPGHGHEFHRGAHRRRGALPPGDGHENGATVSYVVRPASTARLRHSLASSVGD